MRCKSDENSRLKQTESLLRRRTNKETERLNQSKKIWPFEKFIPLWPPVSSQHSQNFLPCLTKFSLLPRLIKFPPYWGGPSSQRRCSAATHSGTLTGTRFLTNSVITLLIEIITWPILLKSILCFSTCSWNFGEISAHSGSRDNIKFPIVAHILLKISRAFSQRSSLRKEILWTRFIFEDVPNQT